MMYIGIDIGAKGGIVGLDEVGDILFMYRIPKKNGSVDFPELAELINSLMDIDDRGVICIEDIHSIYGMSAKSNFSFGFIKGFKVACCMMSTYRFEQVAPKIWQKEIWEEDDIVRNGRKKDTKATSLNAAKRIFPDQTFVPTKRHRVPHDGLVDSALIAEYAKRKF